MDHFPMKTKYKRSKPGRVIRINQEACDALDMLGDKWDVVATVRRTALKIARQPSTKEGDTSVHT